VRTRFYTHGVNGNDFPIHFMIETLRVCKYEKRKTSVNDESRSVSNNESCNSKVEKRKGKENV